MLAGSTQRYRKRSKAAGDRIIWFYPPYSNPDGHQPRSGAPLPSCRDVVTLEMLHTSHHKSVAFPVSIISMQQILGLEPQALPYPTPGEPGKIRYQLPSPLVNIQSLRVGPY